MKREYLYAIIIAIAGLGLMWWLNSRYHPFVSNTTNAPVNRNNTVTQNQNSSQQVSLSLTEISRHNSAADCWLVINNEVYDVTSYLRAHPGGVGIVVPYCGQPDGTQAFATKAGRGSHSSTARTELQQFLLGPVNSTTTTSTINSVQNINVSSFGGEDDD